MQSLSAETIRHLKSDWPRLLLLGLLVLLSLRLILVVSSSPAGWRSLRNDWEDQVLRQLGRTTSIGEEPPPVQAQFWLDQVNRIPATQTDPQVALGAAWMLAEPQYGFLKRNITSSQDLQERSKEIVNTFDQSQAEYQSLGRAACLEQAAIATRLAPENVEFWRQRALLLFATRKESEREPYPEDWLQVLEEGAAHDPENALYDYLAALQFYQLSAEPEWDEEYQLTLKITDPQIYAQAEQRLQAGLKKTTLDVGTSTWSATLAFLKQTSLPLEDQLKAAEERNASYPAISFVAQLQRWLIYACESDLQHQKYDTVIKNAGHLLRISEQLTGPQNFYEQTFFKYSLRTSGLGQLFMVLQVHPESFTPAKTAELKQDLQQAWLREKIFMEALDRYHQRRKAQPAGEASLAAALTGLCEPFILFLLPLSLLLILTARLTGQPADSPAPRPGWWRTLIAWFSGVSLSLFIWGVIPADVVSEPVWNVLLLVLCWVGLILVFTVSLRLLHKRENLTWQQLTSLLLVLAAPVLIYFQFASLLAFVEQNWIHTSLALLIPVSLLLVALYGTAVFIVIRFIRSSGRSTHRKLTVSGLVLLMTLLVFPAGAEVFQASLNPAEMHTWFGRDVSVADENPFRMLAAWNRQPQKQVPAWIWIYPQWTARHGEGFAVLLSLSILLSWSLLRWSRCPNNPQPGSTEISPHPQNWQAGVRLLSRSSLIALLALTIVYLAAFPSVIHAENRDHQKRSQALLNLLQPVQEVERIQSEIKHDPALMKSFNQQIKGIKQRLIEEADRINDRTLEEASE
ncbi:hypothetical protein [Gimesia panareensis]|uniref:Tetratricopeptide repeat protein n=1 Tax=Gimesia panareensis TaxID=2527978 RepID=A0A518A3V9_9PLAN|nr:hypothetical protein [Gimesia panareensis]QDT27762.1 hypothetical protein Enr10x_30920 [Gimesia panareensis]QDU49418.1 hypothetical protein Pan110_17420 [Gimesia panareensis]QDV17363.1 hypothetical protein Pan153_20110 [Gimesia panareensis]